VSEPLLRVDAIDVFYGDVQVLYGLSLHVEEGEIVTLLGSNGAGKTTTLRILATFLAPSAGQAIVLGHDVVRWTGREGFGSPGFVMDRIGRALMARGWRP